MPDRDWITDELRDDAQRAEAGDRLASAGHQLNCECMATLDEEDCDCGLVERPCPKNPPEYHEDHMASDCY